MSRLGLVSVEASVDGREGEGLVLALGWLEVDGADHQQVAHPLKIIAQLSLTAASFSQPPSQFSCQELASDALVQLGRESWKVCFGMEGKLWEAEMGPFLTSHRTVSL